jgi:hypothetical protein
MRRSDELKAGRRVSCILILPEWLIGLLGLLVCQNDQDSPTGMVEQEYGSGEDEVKSKCGGKT